MVKKLFEKSMLLKKWLRGRPSQPGSAKAIRLQESMYNLWRTRKTAMGFGNSTDSVFEEILLHCSYNGTGEILLR